MKQKIFTPTILVLVATLGIITYTFLSSSFTFKDQLFSLLYPKTTSLAQETLSVSITRPQDNSILSGNVTANIAVSIPENIRLSKVEIFIDDSLHCTTKVYPFTCEWRVPSGNGNRHRILAKAYDDFDNIASHSIAITVR